MEFALTQWTTSTKKNSYYLSIKTAVTAGETVTAGQVIGFVGSTGDSTGNHLHLGAKKYPKSGVMENGAISKTEEGSLQGGPLFPLLANIYFNEFDWEMYNRGIKPVRYADVIAVLAKSKHAAERLLKYPEGRLKLKMNTEKSKVTSIFAQKNFKFLGF